MKKKTKLPPGEHPESKVMNRGVKALTNVELLATFLGSGVQGSNVKQISAELLHRFGCKLFVAEAKELMQIRGIGKTKASRLASMFELAGRLATGLDQQELNQSLYQIQESSYQKTLFEMLRDAELIHKRQHVATFIDVFAGIGGIRLAFEAVGGRCIWSCEWDQSARKTYEVNFGEIPHGDIREITVEGRSDDDISADICDHEILTAGFPCQPFSLAGVSKKNALGRKHGFEDPTQGTLFFDLKRIIHAKRPTAFFLENVKNLFHHDQGRTWEIIRSTLEDDLKYVVNWNIVNAANWVPQHRKRIFIVGYNPDKIAIDKKSIVIPEGPPEGYRYPKLNRIIKPDVDPRYVLGPGTWATLERHKTHHAAAGNGFGYSMHRFPIPEDAVTRTISARYHKDGAEALVETQSDRPRKLTVEEAAQLQGFDPRTFEFPVSDTQAYRQIGNSVAIPAVMDTAREMMQVLKERRK